VPDRIHGAQGTEAGAIREEDQPMTYPEERQQRLQEIAKREAAIERRIRALRGRITRMKRDFTTWDVVQRARRERK